MSRPRIGVILSGCGVYDGTEIHEAVLTLLALDRIGAEAVCLAPDMPQMHVIDHRTGQPTGETRNVLTESARIARGKVEDLVGVTASTLDGLVLPGGFGAAKNLSTFATKGEQCSVHPEVARLVRALHEAGRPVAALCIAPVILAKLLGAVGPRLTIGNDRGTAEKITAMGARHVACAATDVVVDEELRLVTTPAYMLGQSLAEVATGIEKAVAEVVRLSRVRRPALQTV